MHVSSLPRHRNRLWLRDTEGGQTGGGGGADSGLPSPGGPPIGGGKPAADDGKGGGSTDGGDEWEPITTKEQFEDKIKRRIGQVHRQYADYEGLKAKASEYDQLLETTKTEHDQAVTQARAEGFNEAMGKTVPNLVRTAFRAESTGKLTTAQVDALLEDLDLVKYATDDGEPDWEKIQRKVKAVGGTGNGGGGNGRGPDFGQGGRSSGGNLAKGEAGAAMARQRFGTKTG